MGVNERQRMLYVKKFFLMCLKRGYVVLPLKGTARGKSVDDAYIKAKGSYILQYRECVTPQDVIELIKNKYGSLRDFITKEDFSIIGIRCGLGNLLAIDIDGKKLPRELPFHVVLRRIMQSNLLQLAHVEISASGNGVHVIFVTEEPTGIFIPKGKITIEIFSPLNANKIIYIYPSFLRLEVNGRKIYRAYTLISKRTILDPPISRKQLEVGIDTLMKILNIRDYALQFTKPIDLETVAKMLEKTEKTKTIPYVPDAPIIEKIRELPPRDLLRFLQFIAKGLDCAYAEVIEDILKGEWKIPYHTYYDLIPTKITTGHSRSTWTCVEHAILSIVRDLKYPRGMEIAEMIEKAQGSDPGGTPTTREWLIIKSHGYSGIDARFNCVLQVLGICKKSPRECSETFYTLVRPIFSADPTVLFIRFRNEVLRRAV